ncbi:MAG TPA: site-specific integrase [Steroidobacteraceae bacterium]|nr:site-specific integrase [Steroidobacteraceae bacterium]
MPEAERRAIRRVGRVLDTGEVVLLSDALGKYLAECARRGLRKQTLREKQRTYAGFATWLGDDPEVAEITRRTTGRYVTDHLLPQGHAIKTVKDSIGHLSAFFEWMLGRGEFGLDANPWRGVSKTVRASTRGTRPKRRPWTDAELKRLLEGIKTDDPLWPMVAIAAYTGMRREEIANLRTQEVAEAHLSVTEGKTKVAVRDVPLHPVIAILVTRLREQWKDGFLIPGLLRGGADEKRGHYVGKRFSHQKRALGFADETLNFTPYATRLFNAARRAESLSGL